MHEMYGVIWKVALRIHEFLPVSKRGCYLALNTLLWCLMGMILYGAAILLTPYIFSTLYCFATAGYLGMIMGFGGGSMFILRNTQPDWKIKKIYKVKNC